MPAGNRRENFLTVYAPMWLLLLIALWALSMVLAFGMMQWGAGSRMASPDGSESFATTLYMSGTTLFTLGLGDVVPHSSIGRFLTVFESGIGLGFVALVIGYLPVVSQAFSRREASIALLDARAGSPPTAVELLRRHVGDGSGEALVELLRDWERWAAELLESHVSFPVLAFYRSQHDNQSWVAGMTALLDSCALILARREDRLPEAGPADVRDGAPRASPTWPRPERPRAIARARPASPEEPRPSARGARGGPDPASGRPVRRAQAHRAARTCTSPCVAALSTLLLMPLPPWMPPSKARENWLAHL